MGAANSNESEEDDATSGLQLLRESTQAVRHGIYDLLMLLFGSFTRMFFSLGVMFAVGGFVLDTIAPNPTGNMKIWAGFFGIWSITCFVILIGGTVFKFVYRRYM